MGTITTAAARLRNRIQRPGILIAPGAADALTARIITRAGFEATYFTGAGFSYTHLGAPDLGLVSLTDTVWRLGAIVEATPLPVIADGDTGYGNALNVARTVREFESAGAAAIQLEDQIFPKRCGHLSGKELISAEEMIGKIRAALDARRDTDFMIIARTDARANEGLEAAIARAERYQAAGADLLFVEAPTTKDELAAIPKRIKGPVMANMVEGGATPLCSAPELAEMGYRLVIFPGAAVRIAAAAIGRLMATLKAQGTTASLADQMLSFRELNDVLDLQRYEQLEDRYSPGH